MKELVYDVAKGLCWLREGDAVTRLGKGYSGHYPFVNDPTASDRPHLGPIPRGSYRVCAAFDHARLGPCVMFLEPMKGTQTFGRGGFFIHGDNYLLNRSASSGCIVLARGLRETIAKERPLTLVVV